MPPRIPPPWLDFLRDVDRVLGRSIEVHSLGGFVLGVLYDLPRPTASVDTPKPAINRHLKTGHKPWRPRPGAVYLTAASVRKSVCTFVRQLRGPHLRTWA